MTELSQILLSPNVMAAIVEIINFNFVIGGRYRFQFVISAQLSAKEHESIPVFGQVLIDKHISSARVFSRGFDEMIRSTNFNMAIICLGYVRFRSGLPIWGDTIISSFCRGIPTAETASGILSLVFSSAVSGIPATRTKGLRPFCSSSSIF